MTLSGTIDESEAAAMRKDARLRSARCRRRTASRRHLHPRTADRRHRLPRAVPAAQPARADERRPTRSSCGQATRRRRASGCESNLVDGRPLRSPHRPKPSRPGSGRCAATWRARGLDSRRHLAAADGNRRHDRPQRRAGRLRPGLRRAPARPTSTAPESCSDSRPPRAASNSTSSRVRRSSGLPESGT